MILIFLLLGPYQNESLIVQLEKAGSEIISSLTHRHVLAALKIMLMGLSKHSYQLNDSTLRRLLSVSHLKTKLKELKTIGIYFIVSQAYLQSVLDFVCRTKIAF